MTINPIVVKAYAVLLQIQLGCTGLSKYITKEEDRKNQAQVLLKIKEGYEETVALYIVEHSA